MSSIAVSGRITLIAVIVIASGISTSAIAAPLNETWSATFGGPDMDNGFDVAPTSDEGFIIAGDTRSTDSVVSTDAWLIKTTGTGSETWNRKFGGSMYDSANSVAVVPGGYILAGRTLSFSQYGSEDAWLIRTDSSGTELWNRTYGGGGTDIFQSVAATAGGGVAAAGVTTSFGSGNSDMYLVRIAENGTEEWHSTFGGENTDRAMGLQQLPDGGYILVGTTYSLGQNETNIYVVRTDSRGTIVWQKTFGRNRMNFGNDVLALPDGGFIVVGYTDPYPSAGPRSVYAAKIDASGSLVWEKTPGNDRIISEGRSVAATADRGYVITGGSIGLFLVGLSSDGTTLWEQVISRSPNDWGNSIEPIPGSDGFIIGGFREQPGNNWDVYLMRVDPESVQPSPITLPGPTNPPSDPDSDGLYEDLNGNGRLDFADIVLFFEQMDWISANEPVTAFDMNGNDRIDFNDIVLLFREI
jgi:PKD repeat protein